MQCANCGHVQLRHVITGLFEDYKYHTPLTVKRYLEPVAKALKTRVPNAKSVLEIGSNNGMFLEVLRANYLFAVGVDPASTHPYGIKAAFGDEFAKGFQLKFDIVVGNNVFAHIDDLEDVFRGIDRVLMPDGVIVFEVQYLPDLLEAGAFDMIYHEHLDYHTLRPLAGFLKRMGFVMEKWEHIPNHGGSIRVWAVRKGLEPMLPAENLDFAAFRKRVVEAKTRLTKTVKKLHPLVAFGAAAKACTLISEFEIAQYIGYCVDDTPQKQGRYIPGTDIQIRPVETIGTEPVLMTAWNYEREIAERISNRLIRPFA